MLSLGHSVEKLKSSSGLTILFLEDKYLPYISYQVMFPRAGSDYDPKRKAGLSALTAYLLDQGAGGFSSEKIQEELNALGTELDIHLGRQVSLFSLKGLSWQEKKLFDLFKMMLSDPHFEKKEMEALRRQFLDRRVKSLDQAGVVASQAIRKSLFLGPKGEPKYGDLISLPQIQIEDVKAFYRENYKKGNPIFMVTGKFDSNLKQKFLSFVDDNFAFQELGFKKQDQPKKTPATLKLISNEDLVQAEVRLAYELFPFPANCSRDFVIMSLGNFILGGNTMTSRLFVEVRDKRGLTYSIRSLLHLGKLYGFFEIGGATKNASVAEFLKQVLLNLNKIKEHGVTKEELETAKQQFRMHHLEEIEVSEDRLYHIAYYNYLGLDDSFLNNYLKMLESISLEEVNQSFQKFILSQDLQVVVYAPSSVKNSLKDIEGIKGRYQEITFKNYLKEEISTL